MKGLAKIDDLQEVPISLCRILHRSYLESALTR
jgi:hypothetical protein